MGTKNTVIDIMFAEQFVNFSATRATSPSTRVRASVVAATIRVLNEQLPNWRELLVAELDANNITRDPVDLFPIPHVDEGELFSAFMKSIITKESPNG